MVHQSLDFASALDAITQQVPSNLLPPLLGVICGSGLSGLVNSLKDVHIVPYDKIPGFSKSTGRCPHSASPYVLLTFLSSGTQEFIGIR